MKFLVSSSLYYQAFDASTVICSLNCHRSAGQQILDESLSTNRDFTCTDLIVGLDANRFARVDIADACAFSIEYRASVQLTPSLVEKAQVKTDRSSAFEAIAVPYLAPSRYVPADRMRNLSNDIFGNIPDQLDQALAVEDWLFQNIQYQIGASDEQSWSLDTFENRCGVCRDFAHLGIAFCRALNIPSRYVTVYAYQLIPQDFHAVFEVFIGGHWWLIDGTRLAPLNGMIRIAAGRDAADTALGNLFGPIQGNGVQVWTQLDYNGNDGQSFSAITRDSLRNEGKILRLD